MVIYNDKLSQSFPLYFACLTYFPYFGTLTRIYMRTIWVIHLQNIEVIQLWYLYLKFRSKFDNMKHILRWNFFIFVASTDQPAKGWKKLFQHPLRLPAQSQASLGSLGHPQVALGLSLGPHRTRHLREQLSFLFWRMHLLFLLQLIQATLILCGR